MPDPSSSPTPRWLDRLITYFELVKKHGKWLGRLLTIGALAYIGYFLLTNWGQLRQIEWGRYGWAIALSLPIYLFSLLLQLFVWLRMLSYRHQVGWQDVQIFMQTVLLRQLPGGVWHWLGRGALYEAETAVSAKTVLYANALDWSVVLITAVSTFALFSTEWPLWLRLPLLLGSLLLALWLTGSWLPTRWHSRAAWQEGASWIAAYMGSWLAGGSLLMLFVLAAGGNMGVREGTAVWAAAGGISAIMIIAPAGLGIRELSLTYFLQPFMSTTEAIILSLLLRLTFTLADLLWGAAGWLLVRQKNKKIGQTRPLQEKNW